MAKAIGLPNFAKMETKREGVVEKPEFVAAGGSEPQFDRYDLNRDGVLDGDELAKRSAAQADAAQDMQRMDTNKDGLVDQGEFVAGGGGGGEAAVRC